MCPLNFILPFLYFSSRFDFFAPKENWREIFKSKSRVSKKTLYLTKYIFTRSDRSKSFQTPKKRSRATSLEQKLPPWDTPFPFFIPIPLTHTCRINPRTGSHATTRPFSRVSNFKWLPFFLPSFSFSLSLSLSALPTNRPPPRWKAETRRRRGWRSDEKEGMRGNDKKSRKIARKIFQARYGELPYPRYEKEIFKRGALIHRWPPSPLRDRRTWPGIKCPIKYCGHVNILVKFSSTSLVRRIDHVFSSRRWYDRRDISSIFFSIVDRCSDFYPIVIWGCNFGDDWMRIGDKIWCNVSAIFGCIWTIACKSFLYIFVEFVSSSRLSDSYYGNVRYSWNTFLGLISEIKVN